MYGKKYNKETFIAIIVLTFLICVNALLSAAVVTELFVIKNEIQKQNVILTNNNIRKLPEMPYVRQTSSIVCQPESDHDLAEEDIKLIAQVVMAEAESEPKLGQILVIDTILNRVDNDAFPNTVYEVVNQPGQYTSEDNARFHKCYPRSDLVQLVKDELALRTDNEVLFFRTEHFHNFGVPVVQVGHHYFSKL